MSARGHNRERQVRKLLEADGWIVVRSAGSLGPVDLVALKPDRVLLIEVKSTIQPYQHFRKPERAEMLEIAIEAGASCVLAYWPSHGQLRWIRPQRWPEPGRLPAKYRRLVGLLPGEQQADAADEEPDPGQMV
jgi:Holliday junction resolvase